MITRISLIVLLLLCSSDLVAKLYIHQLNHRSADEVKALIEPHLKYNEKISASRFQLILNVSPKRYEDLKPLINELDKAPGQWLVQIKSEKHHRRKANQHETTVTVGPHNSGIRVDAHSTRDRGNNQEFRSVRVMQGKSAFIGTSQLLPGGFLLYGQGQTITLFQTITDGFYITPVIARDDQVRVSLSLKHQSQTKQRAINEQQQLSTELWLTEDTWSLIGSNRQSGSHKSLSTRDRKFEATDVYIRLIKK
ncbi:hypothetical protein [Pleionea sp. CnH1-48]|uniref:hypothetical protein n=1 Tax=Pleionea sp. CnH1-48 TaxID=2954494 RepID=UPI002097E079|nr:hypothetical protein [Pleionea sp. CnH1-48]MCO7222789.1 hypothetical protein [Pleionea sp. CnH1-48]